MLSEETKSLLFSFKGRMNRKPFIIIQLLAPILAFSIIMIIMGIVLLCTMIVEPTPNDEVIDLATYIIIFYSVTIPVMFFNSWIIAASTAKRMHDMNCSGWWAVLIFIPPFSLFALIWASLVKGTVGPNRFGNDRLINLPEGLF